MRLKLRPEINFGEIIFQIFHARFARNKILVIFLKSSFAIFFDNLAVSNGNLTVRLMTN